MQITGLVNPNDLFCFSLHHCNALEGPVGLLMELLQVVELVQTEMVKGQ